MYETLKDIQTIQDDEKLVIQSIFGDDAVFAEQKWKVWRPMDVTIHLEPQCSHDEKSNKEARRKMSVELKVTCGTEYPGRPPHLELQDVQGISQERCKELLEILNTKAKELIGNVMINELAEIVRDFLGKQDSRPVGSFHDNMMKNKALEVGENQRKRLDSERKELIAVAEEQEKIALERQAKRENDLGKQLEQRVEGECRIIGGRRIVVLTNIPVKRKRIHPSCNEWMGFWNNEQLLVSEWTFRHTLGRNASEAKKKDFSPFLKKLEEVTDELNTICEASIADPNLVDYSFIHAQKPSTTSTNFVVQVFVAQKIYPTEENLQDVYHAVSKNAGLLRRLAAQAVCALRYLHEIQMTHSALTMRAVWLNENVFRFSDFGSLSLLTDLSNYFNEIATGKKSTDSTKPSETEKPRRKDLFHLGTLLDELTMAARSSTYSRAPTPNLPSDAGVSLAKFIAKCQEAKNIDQLVDDPFLNHEVVSEDDNLFQAYGGVMDSQCRVLKEFVLISKIGKGGFGDVLLTRNKLDGMDYAVKRIPLNSGSERLNRRIKKEARLFANLNHPNIVRYFSAWQEELLPLKSNDSSLDSSDDSCAVPIPGKKRIKAGKNRETLREIAIEENENEGGYGDSLLPPKLRAVERVAAAAARSNSRRGMIETSEWSTSYKVEQDSDSSSSSDISEKEDIKKKTKPNVNAKKVRTLFSPQGTGPGNDELEVFWESENDFDEDEEEEEDDDETEESEFRKLSIENDSDDDIVFGDGSNVENKSVRKDVSKSKGRKSVVQAAQTPIIPSRPKLLIIQMEWCGKGTLRQCIDEGLFVDDPNLVWRMFTEVLSGLQYIHHQGMIHRDIKPLNIFLNSQQSVKIGDFGLATREYFKHKKIVDKSGSNEGGNAVANSGMDQTRDIGTQMYMAPELFQEESTKNKPYTSKIDVYSAGVVLFEMFYRPLPPGMERISTLNALKNDSTIPSDFGTTFPTNQTLSAKNIIEWMLKKNPDDRPSVDELLNAENLPMNKGEDAQFQRQFQRIAKKRGNRMHQWVMDSLFDEDIPVAVNYCYDAEICKEKFSNSREQMIEQLRAEFSIVLRNHSFELIHTHTLVPSSTARASAPVRLKPAEFLDRGGLPLALPIDLRQNFVRYCVRNAVNRLKRYNFGRVYWDDDSKCNTHPHERWECSVDSIGPQASSTTLDAELLLTACQIICGSLRGLKITLRIGHIQLIDAVLKHIKVNEDLRGDVLNGLHCFSTSDKVLQKHERIDLLGKSIGTVTAEAVIANLPCETSIGKFRDSCRSLLKSRETGVSSMTEAALKELAQITEIFFSGASEEVSKIHICYDAQTSYRPRTFNDGLVFQILVGVPNKRGILKNVSVIAGGRYDSHLLRERHPRDIVPSLPRSLSGFSVSMETVAEIRRRVSDTSGSLPRKCSTLVCSMTQPDNNFLLAEKFKLAKALWESNLPCDVLHEPVTAMDSLNEHCEKKAFSHILFVCNSAPEIVVRSHGTDMEKMNMEKAISTVCREKNNGFGFLATKPSLNPSLSSTPPSASHHDEHSNYSSTPLTTMRSASASHIISCPTTMRQSSASVSNLNVIIGVADRLNAKDRKRIESQVKTHLNDEVPMFCSKMRIEVIVCDVTQDLIKKIAGELTKYSSTQEIELFFDTTNKTIHGKCAKELDALGKQLQLIISNSHSVQPSNVSKIVIIIYRHVDNFYRILT